MDRSNVLRARDRELSEMDSLAVIGTSGMGALTYEPEYGIRSQPSNMSLDDLAFECEKLLSIEYTNQLDELFRLGGSSGGARPKILTNIGGEHATTVNVNGKEPGIDDLLEVGRKAGIREGRVRAIAAEVEKTVRELLKDYIE